MRLRSWALVLALLLTGCSSPDEEQSAAGQQEDRLANVDVSDASAEQAEEVSDGTATADEYEAAFARYRECLSAAGYELWDLRFEDHRYRFGVPDDAVDSGVDAECYGAEYRYVDMLWQSTDQVRNNSYTAQVIGECLQERGIEPAEAVDEKREQLREAGIELPECL